MDGDRLLWASRCGLSVACALGVTTCLVSPVDEPAVTGTAVQELNGEPQDGFPTWRERAILVWTNRARADPQADLAACPKSRCAERDCYKTAVSPLVFDYKLARSSRFHCANLRLTSNTCLQHPSPCTVVSNIGDIYTPGTCSGAPSCGCQGGHSSCGTQGTQPGNRIALFGHTGTWGENVAYDLSNFDPPKIFYLWLHEPETSSTCGFRESNGHRYNILSGKYTKLGPGNDKTHWGQDFGDGGQPDRLVAGVHYPETGSSIDFRANWYAGAPKASNVNIDGTCTAMTVERGTPENGTYLATVQLASGCHHYFFEYQDSLGTIVTYPTTGSFGVGCSADWESSRPTNCDGTGGNDPGGSGDSAGGSGGSGGGVGGTDALPSSGGVDSGSRPVDLLFSNSDGGCGCRLPVKSNEPYNGSVMLLLVAGGVLVNRRRRQS